MPWPLRVMLTILPVLLLAYIYGGWKLYNALNMVVKWPREQIRWFLIGGVGCLNLHPLLLGFLHWLGLHNVSRSIREGNRIWDMLFTYPFWLGLIVIVEVLPWLILSDFVKLPFYPFYDRLKSNWLQLQSYVIVGLFALFTVYVVVRVALDSKRVRVSEVVFSDRTIPPSLNGLKIVHISDVQIDRHTRPRKIKRYVKAVNKLKPDLIFFTGDLVTSGTEYITEGAELLGGLESRYGAYACLGDHDYWASAQQVKQQLTENDVITLEDSNRLIQVGFDSLLVTFLTNVYSRRPNLDKINNLTGHQPRGVLDILVTHQPTEEVIEIAAERGYHLLLAGHTHGGQVVFKPFGLFSFAIPRLENRFFRGAHHVGRMLVNINNGLGYTLAPLRYHAPVEVTLIRIVKLPE